MPSFFKTLTVAALVAVGAIYAAWLQSPERAAWARDEQIASLRQTLASERAMLVMDLAECQAAHLEFGTPFATTLCDFTRLQADMARKRMAKLQGALDELLRQGAP